MSFIQTTGQRLMARAVQDNQRRNSLLLSNEIEWIAYVSRPSTRAEAGMYVFRWSGHGSYKPWVLTTLRSPPAGTWINNTASHQEPTLDGVAKGYRTTLFFHFSLESYWHQVLSSYLRC